VRVRGRDLHGAGQCAALVSRKVGFCVAEILPLEVFAGDSVKRLHVCRRPFFKIELQLSAVRRGHFARGLTAPGWARASASDQCRGNRNQRKTPDYSHGVSPKIAAQDGTEKRGYFDAKRVAATAQIRERSGTLIGQMLG